MCDDTTGNLINLSLEDDSCHTQNEFEHTNASNPIFTVMQPSFITTPLATQRRDSLDNNPFDCVQKLVDRPDDPFETAEKEACYKARRSMMPATNVKMEKLLSLSDDNLLDEANFTDNKGTPTLDSDEQKYGNNGTMESTGSAVFHTARSIDLENESPPILMSTKSTPDSGSISAATSASSNDPPSSGGGACSKIKKAVDQRQRLLKLCISNSTFNSPVSRRLPTEVGGKVLHQAMFEDLSENMLALESPLKLVEDDLMAEEPPKGTDFEADLEMMKIPILDELHSPAHENSLSTVGFKSTSPPECDQSLAADTLPDLSTLRAKLNSKREESRNNSDISLLIQNLKSLICDDITADKGKRQQAKSLLETLSSALTATDKNEMACEKTETVLTKPQPIVRQGTFDIDLQDNQEESSQTVSNACGETAAAQSISPIKKVPDIMFSSSATYDGDKNEERGDLVLPVVEPLSPARSPDRSSATAVATQPEIGDIMEQLSKLFEKHNLAQHAQNQSDNTSGSDSSHATMPPPSTSNPTFIVVMNATQMSNFFDDSHVDAATEAAISEGSAMRRRSQSLSIHDKVKILQLPLQRKLQTAAVKEDSPVTPKKEDSNEFKTPSRIMRRNSFSNATPYSPRTSLNYSVRQATHSQAHSLSTHHESQHAPATTLRPVPMPRTAHLNSFKPDLKKKSKITSSANSIMRSTGPLKATIPMKKVVPMSKVSPPTPEASTSDSAASSLCSSGATLSSQHMNTSMHLLAKAGQIPHTSTPMPTSRKTNSIQAGTGYLNAWSTPSVHHTPVRHSTGFGMNKSRYSNIATTPVSKPTAPTVSTANLKRRTLCEFKSKSPNKSRIAMASAASTVATTRAASARLQTSVPKAANRLSTTLAPTRMPTRNSRVSFGGTMATNKDKENKHP